MKKWLALLVGCTLVLGLAACGGGAAGDDTTAKEAVEEAGEGTDDGGEAALNIAYQYGLAYAPLMVAQEQKLIENAYREATGGTLTITWTQMSSGADINTGIASGSIDVGFLGVAPAIAGVAQNVGYKIFTNLSGQEHGMMTNVDSIRSLSDLVGTSEQIALVNIGSIQHIILAKALSENGQDAHALDANIVAMKHPDGMTALESGSAAAHLTSSPYIFMERDNDTLHELQEVNQAWTVDKSFIVGVAAESLHDNEAALYQALCDGLADAITYTNDNLEEVAQLTYTYDGNTVEEELLYLQKGSYAADTSGVTELAAFMYDNGFIDTPLAEYGDIVFDNVKGD